MTKGFAYKDWKRRIDPYVFSIAIASNMFSMSALLVFLGLIGKAKFAADVGIVQAATLAVFFAFSANARNLVLRCKSDSALNQLLKFRFSLLPVLAFASYMLSVGIVDVSESFVFALIGRRCSEWLAELHVTERERIGDLVFGFRFVAIQTGSFFLLMVATIIEYPAVEVATLAFWAFSPILLSPGFLLNWIMKRSTWRTLEWTAMLPHLGSSWVIGLSTYVFRLLLVLLLSRPVAGLLFSAYAAGGMINAVYTYALGPSLSLKSTKEDEGSRYRIIAIIVSVIALAGSVVAVWAYAMTPQSINPNNASFFWIVFGISMIGSAVMIIAQRVRIRMLQIYHRDDVWVPDVLANILIIASVPFAYYLFGYAALPYLFLWNAILNWSFYQLASIEAPIPDDRNYNNHKQRTKMIRRLNRQKIQSWVLFFICLPVFFQLSGRIFNAKDFIFDTQGSLLLVPLPISVIACYLGLALLVRFDFVKITASFVFAIFLLMLLSTFAVASTDNQIQLDKTILLIQFILPVFGIVLGQSYREPKKLLLRYEAIFFYIIAIIVPLELIASWNQKHLILLPHIYFFSVHQHLQYIPVISICLYFLAIATLYEQSVARKLLFFVAPFIGMYAVASLSMLAILITVLGSLLTVIILWQKGSGRFAFILAMLLIVPLSLYGLAIKTDPNFAHKFQVLFKSQQADNHAQTLAQALPNLGDRLHYWKYYLKGILENPKVFFLGHEKRPDRAKFPSAHNYYLDLVYNFGLIALVPFLVLITYTIIQLKNRLRNGPVPLDLIALALLVLFFVLVDNSLKVGFRQPYSGIIMFFLWGVLLARLSPQTDDTRETNSVIA